MDIQYDFYRNLYTSASTVQFTLQNMNNISLSEVDRHKFDNIVTMEGMFDAVMTLRGGKTLGADGLTVELFHKFWKILAPPLHRNFLKCVGHRKLNCSARRGIINLIPKKGKDPFLIKNWRPITLLNYDYKI